MSKRILYSLLPVVIVGLVLSGCSKTSDEVVGPNKDNADDVSIMVKDLDAQDSKVKFHQFVHGIVVTVDGEDYYLAGAPDGSLLYKVHAVVDRWSKRRAKLYARRGFVHYHELVKVSDGSLHPNKVLWLRHIAVRNFTLDGGPHPELSHSITPGIDFDFIPNGMMPYNPVAAD